MTLEQAVAAIENGRQIVDFTADPNASQAPERKAWLAPNGELYRTVRSEGIMPLDGDPAEMKKVEIYTESDAIDAWLANVTGFIADRGAPAKTIFWRRRPQIMKGRGKHRWLVTVTCRLAVAA